MKNRTFSIVFLILSIGIFSACGSNDATGQEPQTPKEIDAVIYTSISKMDDYMDALNDNIEKLAAKNITPKVLWDTCDSVITACRESLDAIETYEKNENVIDYVTAAQDVINNVAAAHIKMQDFLDKGEPEDLEYTFTCFQMRNTANISFVAAREKYLMDSGFTADDVSAINKELGISSES